MQPLYLRYKWRWLFNGGNIRRSHIFSRSFRAKQAYRLLGADAAGMSTVPEAISAAYCQMKIIGISTITNYCTGVKGGNPSHEETIETAQKASADLALLVKQIIKDLPNG